MSRPDALRLYSPDAFVTVRSGRTTIDDPTTGVWTPDNRNPVANPPDEEPDPPSDFILDAREWEDLRLVAEFAGAPTGAETVEIETLISVPTDSGGRVWATLQKVTLAPNLATDVVPVRGHFCAFRITAINLTGGATAVKIKATGGTLRRQVAGG